MKTYKGFRPGLTCRGFKYELGRTEKMKGDVDICYHGYHSCKLPLDVLSYYPPHNSVYAECKVGGDIEGGQSDSKIASSVITPVRLLSLAEMIGSHVKVMKSITKNEGPHAAATEEESHTATTGAGSHAVTTGAWSHAAAAGDRSHAATTGAWSHAATAGEESHAATTGTGSHAATTGTGSHAATAGEESHAVTTGADSYAVTTGEQAHALTTGGRARAITERDAAHAVAAGKDGQAAVRGRSVAAAFGNGGKVRGGMGSILVCAWYDHNGRLRAVRTAKITKKSKVRPGRWYTIDPDTGKWKEVEE